MSKGPIAILIAYALLVTFFAVRGATTKKSPALAGEDTPAVRIERVDAGGLAIYTDRENGVVCYGRKVGYGYGLSCVQPWPTEPETK